MDTKNLVLRSMGCDALDELWEEATGFFKDMQELDTVCLDLNGMKDINSMSIMHIVELYKATKCRGGEFKVLNASEHVRKALTVCNINRYINIDE